MEGFEADDLIATYARQAVQAGGDVTIISSDKDLMQMIEPGIAMLDTMKNKRIGPDEVFEKFGVKPDKVIDVQSLAGDSTDNVPGVPGIGVKTAAELITTYGDLDTLLARAGEIKQPKRREKLIEFAEQARISRQLVTLKQDVPVEVALDTAGVADPDPAVLLGFLRAMEFNTLTKRVAEGLGAPVPAPLATSVGDSVGKAETRGQTPISFRFRRSGSAPTVVRTRWPRLISPCHYSPDPRRSHDLRDRDDQGAAAGVARCGARARPAVLRHRDRQPRCHQGQSGRRRLGRRAG